MIRTTLLGRVLGVCLVSCAVCATACGSDSDVSASTSQGVEHAGTLSMPLTVSANGHTYRLRNVYIAVSGPTYTTLSTSDDPNETVLSAALQTGTYSAQLYGWQLERSRDDGTFSSVQATLISSTYVNFDVFNGSTTTISYEFQTDGAVLTVGSGALHVTAKVDEVPGVCTPFGTDCAPNTWCAPPELTGRPLACIAAGVVPIGESCSAPADCVVGAACIDFGKGAVCAELCPSAATGSGCESGGTCESTASSYGVCTPDGSASPVPG